MKAIALAAILLTASLAPDIVRNTAQQVASWQLSHLHEVPQAPETDWTRAAFYIGLARWAATPGQTKYFDAIRELGERTGWQIGDSDGAPRFTSRTIMPLDRFTSPPTIISATDA